MDGENNGKHYFSMDDLGGFPIIFGNTHIDTVSEPPPANRNGHIEPFRVEIWVSIDISMISPSFWEATYSF